MRLKKLMNTYTSKVDDDVAPVVPAVFESHKSQETSATRLEDTAEYVYDQVTGIELIDARVLPMPDLRSRLASRDAQTSNS